MSGNSLADNFQGDAWENRGAPGSDEEILMDSTPHHWSYSSLCDQFKKEDKND